MKKSITRFMAVALVGTALFGATGASAHDRDNDRGWGNRHDRGHQHYKHNDRGYKHHKKVVYKEVYRPGRYVDRHHYRGYDRYDNRGRLIIGFNF